MNTAKDRLTSKQRRFVEEYLIDLNGTQAAIRAGYSASGANRQAARMLGLPHIAAHVAEGMVERNKRTQVTSDWVLQELREIWECDLSDIITPCGKVRPLSEWPDGWKKQINGFELAELWDRSDGKPMQVGDLKKIKWISREKVLEMIGKHSNVGAWLERTQVEVVDKSEIIANARKRASQAAAEQSVH